LPDGLSVYPVCRTAFVIVIRYDIAVRVVVISVHHTWSLSTSSVHLDASSLRDC